MQAELVKQHKTRILIIFSDNSLGGTARSAQLAGSAWRMGGYDVEFLALLGVHKDRLAHFLEIGPVLINISEIKWRDVLAVHYHHGIWSKYWKRLSQEIIDAALHSNSIIPLISHNVFGVPDSNFNRWPGPRITNVLGFWSLRQLLALEWPRRRISRVCVMPNPQNFDFFRQPSVLEREQARETLGIGNEKLVVRVGSPHKGKWSGDYRDLAKALDSGVKMICVGVPEYFQKDLSGLKNVELRERTSSDSELRDYYWAADVFALSASQGESFGNVILEATACGAPVVYRHRPYRDNTPWDFDGIPGFTLATTAKQWVRAVMNVTRSDTPMTDNDWMAPFSLEGTSAQLISQLRHLQGNGELVNTSWRPADVRRLDSLRILCRHNIIFFNSLELIRSMRNFKNEITRSRSIPQ